MMWRPLRLPQSTVAVLAHPLTTRAHRPATLSSRRPVASPYPFRGAGVLHSIYLEIPRPEE